MRAGRGYGTLPLPSSCTHTSKKPHVLFNSTSTEHVQCMHNMFYISCSLLSRIETIVQKYKSMLQSLWATFVIRILQLVPPYHILYTCLLSEKTLRRKSASCPGSKVEGTMMYFPGSSLAVRRTSLRLTK